MNIVLGIVLVCICSVFGYFLADKYVKKKLFYEDFYNFNKTVISDVSFCRISVKKIAEENFIKYETSDFYACFISYLKKDEFDFNKNYLSEEEKSFFKDYLYSVGMKDGLTELKFLNSSEKIIGEKFNAAKVDEKKYRKLYIKLGFLIGLVFLIALL